jgi:hypothetical protein
MACLKADPELFFTDHGTMTLAHPTAKVRKQWDKAKAVCETCPVMRECARDFLGEVEGVWGGLDPYERTRMRHRRNAAIRRGEGSEEYIAYAKLVYELREGLTFENKPKPINDIARLMGIAPSLVSSLHEWYTEYRKTLAKPVRKRLDSVEDLELPETEDEVHPFPEMPPRNGDGWFRYGRRVTWGYYLGQTEDDQWFHVRLKAGHDSSNAWLKAEDVHLTRSVGRTVLPRIGSQGSRIYGTVLSTSHRGVKAAG